MSTRKLPARFISIVLLGVGLWLFEGRNASAPIVVPPDAPAGSAVTPPRELESLAKAPDERPREPATAAQEQAPVSASAHAIEAASAATAEIKGRVLLQGGAPAGGVSVQMQGWESNQERVNKYGLPVHWENPQATTAVDGRFSIVFEPPRAFQFTVRIKIAGYAGANWRWSEIASRDVIDLGDVELPRGGTIIARIVDQSGKVLTTGWTAYAESSSGGVQRDFNGGRDNTRVYANADPRTGDFRLEDLAPGSAKLTAYSRIAN